MTVEKNKATKSPPWLEVFTGFFDNAFARVKGLFANSKSTVQETKTSDTREIKTPGVAEQQTNSYDNSYLLQLPPDIRNKFFRLGSLQMKASSPFLNHAGNHATLALLHINGLYFWGVSNVVPALTPRDLDDIRIILQSEKNFPAYPSLFFTAEADAILQAFKQKMTANRASVFIYRAHCKLCGQREFNATSLGRLLPILSLKELTVYTTDSVGKLTKLVLSSLSYRTDNPKSW